MAHVIKCFNCKGAHEGIAQVKDCHAGVIIAPCDALVKAYSEDGLIHVPCGARAVHDKRGYHCDSGHGYVFMDVREAEGWDYAADEIEQARMEMYRGVVGVIA